MLKIFSTQVNVPMGYHQLLVLINDIFKVVVYTWAACKNKDKNI